MTILTIVQFRSYKNEKERKYKVWEKRPLVLLKNLGTFVYIFCGMNSFHQAYTTLKYPTVRRVVKMGGMTISFVVSLAVIFGFSAYLGLGQDLLNVALFPSRPALDGSKDIANKILKSSKSISPLQIFPLQIFPLQIFPLQFSLQIFPLKNTNH